MYQLPLSNSMSSFYFLHLLLLPHWKAPWTDCFSALRRVFRAVAVGHTRRGNQHAGQNGLLSSTELSSVPCPPEDWVWRLTAGDAWGVTGRSEEVTYGCDRACHCSLTIRGPGSRERRPGLWSRQVLGYRPRVGADDQEYLSIKIITPGQLQNRHWRNSTTEDSSYLNQGNDAFPMDSGLSSPLHSKPCSRFFSWTRSSFQNTLQAPSHFCRRKLYCLSSVCISHLSSFIKRILLEWFGGK